MALSTTFKSSDLRSLSDVGLGRAQERTRSHDRSRQLLPSSCEVSNISNGAPGCHLRWLDPCCALQTPSCLCSGFCSSQRPLGERAELNVEVQYLLATGFEMCSEEHVEGQQRQKPVAAAGTAFRLRPEYLPLSYDEPLSPSRPCINV